MADIVSTQVLSDTSGVKYVAKLTNISDGSGESLVKIHKNFTDPTKINKGEYGDHFIITRNEIKKFVQDFIENYLDK